MLKHILSIKKKLKHRLNQKGFSLVELMVVVAIIGILASIAIPNFQRFQRKARQSGAKIELGGMYTAQQTFITEWGYGTSCMEQHGYGVDGESLYNVGWAPGSNAGNWNAAGSPSGSYNGPPCNATPAYSTLQGGGGGSGAGNFADVQAGTAKYIAINNGATDFGTSYSCTGAGYTNCKLDSSDNTKCVNDGGSCSNTSSTSFGGLVIPGGSGNSLNNISFTIGAIGHVGGGAADVWTINEEKILQNTKSGL